MPQLKKPISDKKGFNRSFSFGSIDVGYCQNDGKNGLLKSFFYWKVNKWN